MKIEIHNKCLSVLKERAEAARTAMNDAQDAANNEDKSSSGDKYETGRAMGHINRDMFAKQLSEATKEIQKLQIIHPEIIHHEASPGALVECASGFFYIATGLGHLKLESGSVMVISPSAPIALAMIGLKAGDSFEFNGKSFSIKAIS